MCGGTKDYSSWLVVALKLPITIIIFIIIIDMYNNTLYYI